MGKKGRKLKQARKYQTREQKEREEQLTSQQIEEKKQNKINMRKHRMDKKRNYNAWVATEISSFAQEPEDRAEIHRSTLTQELQDKIAQLEAEIEEIDTELDDNRELIDNLEEDNEDHTDAIESMIQQEKEFDDEVKKFKSIMIENMKEIHELFIKTKVEKEYKLQNNGDYKIEFEQFLNDLSCYTECPLLLTKMNNPVLAPSGHVYDEISINQCIRSGLSDPLSRAKLAENIDRPHYLCKSIVELLHKYSGVSGLELK